MDKKQVSPYMVGYETAKKLLSKKSIKKIIDKWEDYYGQDPLALAMAKQMPEYVQFRKGFQKAIDEHNEAIRKKING